MVKKKVKKEANTLKTVKEEDVPVENVEEETVVEEAIEEIPVTVEKTLGDKLLELYNAAPPGPLSIQDFMYATGASYDEVAAAWHELFDKGLIDSPQFVKY